MEPTNKNVFDWIDNAGSDLGFEPASEEPNATNAQAGSGEKLRVLAVRAEMGLPLWHPQDQRDLHHERDLEFPDDEQ